MEARARLRLAKKYARLLRHKGPHALDSSQKNLVRQLEDGSLQKAANEATMKSGNGRLRARDGTFLDIGGNAAHSLSRCFLDGYTPPNYLDMDWS